MESKGETLPIACLAKDEPFLRFMVQASLLPSPNIHSLVLDKVHELLYKVGRLLVWSSLSENQHNRSTTKTTTPQTK